MGCSCGRRGRRCRTASSSSTIRGLARQRTNRPKMSSDGVVVAAELRGRNARSEDLLEAENALRRGGHEALSVVVTATVDLSRVDTSLVAHISSFFGTSHDLINLALTCKSFGWRHFTWNWSLVEEVARQAVCSRATDGEMDCLPQYVELSSLPRYVGVATSFLSILHEFEHPLEFDVLLGGCIEHQNGDKTSIHAMDDDYYCTAASSHSVMWSGIHFAEFKITESPWIGIVRPMPNLDPGRFVVNEDCFDFFNKGMWYDFGAAARIDGWGDAKCFFLEQRIDEWGNGNVHACEYWSYNGSMSWTNWDNIREVDEDWEGRESCRTGDTVGMLLNLDEGTLTVYRNDRRLGVMKDGLSGPYCWYVTVNRGQTVEIKRGTTKTSRGQGQRTLFDYEFSRATRVRPPAGLDETYRDAKIEHESKIAHLRLFWPPEGNDGELPIVVVVTTTIDLSRIDTSLVAHISSFIGTSHELLNLALTCKSFGWRQPKPTRNWPSFLVESQELLKLALTCKCSGWRQPTSTLNWSLMEEVARRAVCSSVTDAERSFLPRYISGTTTWLSILRSLEEHLLVFDVLLGCYIRYQNGDKTRVAEQQVTTNLLVKQYQVIMS